MSITDLKLEGGMFHCLSIWGRGDMLQAVAILDTYKGEALEGGTGLFTHYIRKLFCSC